jgi:anti-sigma factor RsiW
MSDQGIPGGATKGTAEQEAALPRSFAPERAAMLATAKPRIHPDEELLEEYCLGRVQEPRLADLEEHLLLCPLCCQRVADLDEYLAVIKAGLAEIVDAAAERHHAVSPSTGSETIAPATIPALSLTTGILNRFSWIPPSDWVKIAALFVFVSAASVAWMSSHRGHSLARPEAEVSLVALRGGETTTASVPAGVPLRLSMDSSSLPEAGSYRIEVVDAFGAEAWNGAAAVANQHLSARVEKILPAGNYWVRIYSADPGGGQLLREFSLRLE